MWKQIIKDYRTPTWIILFGYWKLLWKKGRFWCEENLECIKIKQRRLEHTEENSVYVYIYRVYIEYKVTHCDRELSFDQWIYLNPIVLILSNLYQCLSLYTILWHVILLERPYYGQIAEYHYNCLNI